MSSLDLLLMHSDMKQFLFVLTQMESKKNCQAYESSFYLLSSFGKSFDMGSSWLEHLLQKYFSHPTYLLFSNPTLKN